MAYREKDTKTWTAQWYEIDARGNANKRRKRGFETRREALEYERQKKLGNARDLSMKLSEFVEVYFEDKKTELKERSFRNKRYMMEQHIIPYFGERKMNEITAAQILQWQVEMSEKGYSETYLRMIQNQLTALFTHASRVYDLKNNPCKKVKKMGKPEAGRLEFWTYEEYKKFISTIPPGTQYYLLFELLFWTGCRVGEALAITPADLNEMGCQISIDKTYYRMKGKDVITTPKTEQSVRVIEIPEFLRDELKEYLDRMYGIPSDERIFPIGQEAVQHKMKRNSEKAGVKKIRVHDLRHSHVAYLINRGVEPLIIKERLGHKDIRITLNTYGHLYPSKQRTVADMLDADVKNANIKMKYTDNADRIKNRKEGDTDG